MFKGIITPIVTPFHRDQEQSVNKEAARELIDHLIGKGVAGIFPLGSNGEFHVINSAEKLDFLKEVVAAVDHRVPVYAGTGSCSTGEAIELSEAAKAAGADALSLITPYFIRPSDEEVYGYFKEIAEQVDLPIILYNIPKTTGCNISKEVAARLAKIPNIRGIKDSSGDMENLKGYLEAGDKEQWSVLVGSDSKISEGYRLGASGAIAGTSNLITDIIVGLDQALNAGDDEKAALLQQEIEVLRGVLPLGTVPQVLKRSVELAGIAAVGPARKPVGETSAETDQQIRAMLAHYQLI